MTSTDFTSTYPEEVYAVPSPVTVILDVPWTSLPPEAVELLTKILVAIRTPLEAVRIVHQSNLDMSSWVELPARLIAFIQPPPGLTVYERIQTPTTEMVISEPLSILIADEGAKRKLWNALKTLLPS